MKELIDRITDAGYPCPGLIIEASVVNEGVNFIIDDGAKRSFI